MIFKFLYTWNLLFPCETWACLVKHNAGILTGIKGRHIQRSSWTALSFFSLYSHLLSPSGITFSGRVVCVWHRWTKTNYLHFSMKWNMLIFCSTPVGLTAVEKVTGISAGVSPSHLIKKISKYIFHFLNNVVNGGDVVVNWLPGSPFSPSPRLLLGFGLLLNLIEHRCECKCEWPRELSSV